MDTDLPNPDDLSLATLDATSHHVNWRDESFESWQYWDAIRVGDEPTRCDEEPPVDAWVYPRDQDLYHDYTGYELWELCEGPMMNYAYDLPNLAPYSARGRTPEKAAELLAGLPLCLVQAEFLPTDYNLALTGGGMDFSWEICEAYMRLGFIPPTEFADLPRMSGRGDSERDQKIIEACQRSFNTQKERAGHGAQKLENNFGVPA